MSTSQFKKYLTLTVLIRMQSSEQFSFIGEIARPVEPVNGKMSGALCAAVESPVRLCRQAVKAGKPLNGFPPILKTRTAESAPWRSGGPALHRRGNPEGSYQRDGPAVRPRFLIAKGGITSSDVGVKALHVKRATVIGHLQPGGPVWYTGPESKFPGFVYVIFSSNAEKDDTLKKAVEQLLNPAKACWAKQSGGWDA